MSSRAAILAVAAARCRQQPPIRQESWPPATRTIENVREAALQRRAVCQNAEGSLQRRHDVVHLALPGVHLDQASSGASQQCGRWIGLDLLLQFALSRRALLRASVSMMKRKGSSDTPHLQLEF